MSKLWAERLVAIAIIAIAAFMVTETRGLPHGADSFPLFAEYGIIFLSLIILVRTFVTTEARLAGPVKIDFSFTAMKPVLIIGVTIIYAYAMFKIGFYASSVVFFFIVTYMTGLRDLKLTLITAAVLFPAAYLFFNVALGARMPAGLLM